jgi:hypothetical protein
VEVDQCLAHYFTDDDLLDRLPPASVELQPTETLGVDESLQAVLGDALTDVSIFESLGPLVARWAVPEGVLD